MTRPGAGRRHAKNLHPDLNGLRTADCLWCADVTPHVSLDCHHSVAAAARRIGCADSQAAGGALAWLRLPAGLPAAAEQRLPLYAQKAAVGRSRRDRRPWYIDPTPGYYGYDGNRYYSAGPALAAAATTMAAALVRATRAPRSGRSGI